MLTKNSTHKVEVIPIELQKHQNADSLSVVPVYGYTCCVKTADWQGIRLGAWVPPDSLVDTSRAEFAFLRDQAKVDGKARIKAKKLRGVVSFGLLIPAPEGTGPGDDLADLLGVEHYEPPSPLDGPRGVLMGGEVAPVPDLYTVKYDLESFRRYHHVFEEGEPVLLTEKVDGTSSRYVYWDGQMHCGSRTTWKREYPTFSHVTMERLTEAGKTPEEAQVILDGLKNRDKKKNIWWEMLDKTPQIARVCQDNPGLILHGEIFGNTNCIKFGFPEVNRFGAFDIMKDGRWLDSHEFFRICEAYDVPTVPEVGYMGYNFGRVCELAEGPTLAVGAKPGVIREGVVVRPIRERSHEEIGRVVLKCVSATFLEKYH